METETKINCKARELIKDLTISWIVLRSRGQNAEGREMEWKRMKKRCLIQS